MSWALNQPIVPEIDLHCHILPALDDGARDATESMAMARRAATAGIRHIVATSHVSPDRAEGSAEADLGARMEALRAQVREAGLDLELVPGCEATLSQALIEQVATAPWLTIGGQRRYLLVMVEMPPLSRWPSWVDELVFRLGLAQVVPVICHPERIRVVQRSPQALLDAIRRGARAQITASSLSPRAPRPQRQCARALLRAGAVSFVASDAHRAADVLPGEVVGTVVAAVGAEEARRILVENPRRVLAGEPVPCPPGAGAEGCIRRPRTWGRRVLGRWASSLQTQGRRPK